MKKLVALGASALAIPAAVGIAVLANSPTAASEPANVSSLNVTGEPYGRATAILKSQGMGFMFGGKVGSDVPQAQCIVDSQKFVNARKVSLFINCTKEAAADASGSLPQSGAGGAAGPVVGANGVTTVQATPVGPPPPAG